ncbi:Annexin [Coniochaeta sp. PMI_546]|nr:Annexin [Coniochaeta sp. PMI_546]
MSYPNYPPYGQPPTGNQGYYQQPPAGQYPPPAHSPYPPQQAPQGGYYPPPQPPAQPYGASPPPSPYGQPYGQPPAQAPYGAPAPSPYGAPPAQYGAPPPPAQPYGQPPPQQYPPQPYGAPQAYNNYPPTPPSLGYGPPQSIQWNGDADAHALRSAMKGFGTDEKALIRILATKDPLQIATIRDAYQRIHRRNLEADIKSETRGWFEEGLCALVRGPLMQDVHLLCSAMDGPGTKEKVLNDVLLGRSNADLNAIKKAYSHATRQRLEDAVRGDLSMKTERHFMIVLQAQRAEDSAPVVKADIDRDVSDLYNATEGKVGTDEIRVCSILSTRNDNQIRAIAHEYRLKYARSLEDVIKREFSGHMEDALLYQLRHGLDKYMHQAQLLEDAMSGVGTKDHLLVSRVVRSHWDRQNMDNVKGAYQQRYHKSLASRIKGETSGDYERLMLACIGENV